MKKLWTSFFLLSLWVPVNRMQSEPMATPVKKTASLAMRAMRPVIRVIHGITDDLRWALGLFALAEFLINRGDYDLFNSKLVRLWLATLVVHSVCELV